MPSLSSKSTKSRNGGSTKSASASSRSSKRIVTDEGASMSTRELLEHMEAQVREQPYQMLAMAAGIGFLLGGGLFTRLAGGVLINALRVGMVGASSPSAYDWLERSYAQARQRGGEA
jgi:ElaB/YqjD/DUF883 family membrane-anchored ribosome-binding protein